MQSLFWRQKASASPVRVSRVSREGCRSGTHECLCMIEASLRRMDMCVIVGECYRLMGVHVVMA